MNYARGGRNSQNQLVCRYFQHGCCRYGSSCKFLHQSSRGRHEESAGSSISERLDTEISSDYLSWKRLLRLAPRSSDDPRMTEFWELAVKTLDHGDRDSRQRLAQAIVNEPVNQGLQYIRVLLNDGAEHGNIVNFSKNTDLFLKFITHTALLDCLSIDSYVGDLYNVFSGSGGSRAIPFLQTVCNSFINNGRCSESSFKEDSFVALAMALREILRRIPRARSNDQLPRLIQSLEETFAHANLDKKSKGCYVITRMIDELQQLCDLSKSLLCSNGSSQGDAGGKKIAKSTFPMDMILPGGRHDNDHFDFKDIKIFPTEAEIRCETSNYLPLVDCNYLGFLTGVDVLLDRNFRLLRHDVFGEAISTLAQLLRLGDDNSGFEAVVPTSLSDMQAHCYINTRLVYVSFDKQRGMEFHLSFPQLRHLKGKRPAERQKWWQETKRLDEGSLLAFLFFNGNGRSSILLTVAQKNVGLEDRYGLASGDYATVVARLASNTDLAQQEQLIRCSISHETSSGDLLVEFPGILPGTFVPILENLQRMHDSKQVPFSEWITPGVIGQHIPPPLYARSESFRFDLKPILTNADDFLAIEPGDSQAETTLEKLSNKTSLDKGQCEALYAALTTEFALIQGPPGTGKTYMGIQLMRVLLHNRLQSEIGPILVVCYTNHALDQFLEQLEHIGVQRLVRIGNRSNSDRLEGKTLRVISQTQEKTSNERYQLARSYEAVEAHASSLKQKLRTIHKFKPEWKNFKHYLLRHHEQIYAQFSRIDRDGFTLAGKDEPFNIWASEVKLATSVVSEEDIENILMKAKAGVFKLSMDDRQTLMEHWTRDRIDRLLEDIHDEVERCNRARQTSINIHDEIDRRVIENAHVVGVTTSGLAKRISMLRHVSSKIVICEEAGEVLEAHLLSTLIPSVEHIIQIGDHQQLRPKVTNHNLSIESLQGRQHQLDRSQFERLCVGELGKAPFSRSQLTVQRRMRPEISELIRETQYALLEDHPSILAFPCVVGLKHNVYWLDHDNSEENLRPDISQKSKSNDWEVDMTYALVRHIIRQGVYNSQDVAVLAPYTGQLQKLRTKMSSDFEIVLSERDQDQLAKEGYPGNDLEITSSIAHHRPLEKRDLNSLLRIATVDNFQGEEAKIVIISLVRSNKAKRVGFLKTENRINVLLSRAQYGMYLIGNSETYSNISMWAKVIEMLRIKGCVGRSFQLCCPRHPETEIEVAQPDDFETASPEGGCRLPCDKRLDACGHRCLAKCHSETMHRAYSCPEPCQRLHKPCEHSCPKLCGEKCGLCKVSVNGTKLPCGHIKDGIHCFKTFQLDVMKCSFPVRKEVSGCGHIIDEACFRDVNSAEYFCPVLCSKILKCGHKCSGTCGKCSRLKQPEAPEEHFPCAAKCGRRFDSCNHHCARNCHDGTDCGVCKLPCEVRCEHSRCSKLCHEPCAPCVHPCAWDCEHQGRCYMPCSAPCSRLPCSKRCTIILRCGHQCPGLCGEDCPMEYCQLCCSHDRMDQRVDMLELRPYKEIDLDESPIVTLGCGHFYTTETLDGHMRMNEVYNLDSKTGEYTSLRNDENALLEAPPRCPDCNHPVQQFVTQRYNRIVNRAIIDQTLKRFLATRNKKLLGFDLKIDFTERSLENARPPVLSIPDAHTASCRTKEAEAMKLCEAIDVFCRDIEDDLQPARKLYDATVIALRNLKSEETTMSGGRGLPDPPLLDRRINLEARSTGIRARLILFEHHLRLRLRKSFPSVKPDLLEDGGRKDVTLAKKILAACSALIAESGAENFPRLNVQTRLFYGRAALALQTCWALRNHSGLEGVDCAAISRKYLADAVEICGHPFDNSTGMLKAVNELREALSKECFEVISDEELQSIKKAMLSGSRGLATHSGHWYNCRNGHPFAIGECGLPMEEARCPECGEPVGGQSHLLVQGVTRATQMEG